MFLKHFDKWVQNKIAKRAFAAYSFHENDGVPKYPLPKVMRKEDVLQHLCENVVYDSEDLLALNKPAGLGKIRPENKIKKKHWQPIDDVYIDEIYRQLPQLGGCPHTSIVKYPEKNCSGIMVIAKSREAEERANESKEQGKHAIHGVDTYSCISLGKPVTDKISCKLALKLTGGPDRKDPIPILEDKWTNQDIKSQKAKLVRFEHELVNTSNVASLSRVRLSSDKSNALRLFFATRLLSPLLGDSTYGARVQDVLGEKLLIDPWSNAAKAPQTIPDEVLQALSLIKKESQYVPLCAHLGDVRLPKFRGNNDVIIKAPPPPIFSWICNKLNLET